MHHHMEVTTTPAPDFHDHGSHHGSHASFPVDHSDHSSHDSASHMMHMMAFHGGFNEVLIQFFYGDVWKLRALKTFVQKRFGGFHLI